MTRKKGKVKKRVVHKYVSTPQGHLCGRGSIVSTPDCCSTKRNRVTCKKCLERIG